MTKSFRVLLLSLLLLVGAGQARAELSREQWNELLDVSYKFSWYPQKDLRELLDAKASEYGGSLADYRKQLVKELTGGTLPVTPLEARNLMEGRPWKDYLHLSLAEFDLYLYNNDPLHLQNARTVIGLLAAKREQPEVAFWAELFDTYRSLDGRQRDQFVQGVFRIWQNVVLKLEIEQILMPSDVARAGFVKSLPYLYENVAHLIVQKAILEQEIPELYPLAPIVLDLEHKLTLDKGYKGMIEQVVARMKGINSDNLNINFAVAYLEATSKRYEFEEEQAEIRLNERYRAVRKYHQLALQWADTSKGQATVVTQYVGFLNYVTRRFSYRDDLLASKHNFENVPQQSAEYLDKAIALFDQLATPAQRQTGGAKAGFENREDYLRSMHYLWDAAGKLAVTMADYYKANRRPDDIQNIFPAERPLLQYSALFDRYATVSTEIVPDNAYFLAAYMSRQLADLYRDQARYSVSDRAANLAFAYQVRAVEIFPYDIPALLQLAYQSSEDGSVKKYYQYLTPLSSRLRTSRIISGSAAGRGGDFAPLVRLGSSTIPDVIENGFALVNAQKRAESTEDGLYRKAAVMAKLIKAMKGSEPEEATVSALLKIGEVDFSGSGLATGAPLSANVPGELGAYLSKIEGADDLLPFYRLKNELYAALEHPVHTLLREMFYEMSYQKLQYPALLSAAAASNGVKSK